MPERDPTQVMKDMEETEQILASLDKELVSIARLREGLGAGEELMCNSGLIITAGAWPVSLQNYQNGQAFLQVVGPDGPT